MSMGFPVNIKLEYTNKDIYSLKNRLFRPSQRYEAGTVSAHPNTGGVFARIGPVPVPQLVLSVVYFTAKTVFEISKVLLIELHLF